VNSNHSSDAVKIREQSEALRQAVNSGNVSAVLAVWAADGIMMPPGHRAVEGHEALRDHFQRLFERASLRFEFTASVVEVSGDLAVERLTYTAAVSPFDAAPPTEDVGKGMHVFRRQTDGSWKLTHDVWNGDGPA
jgi:uncharacterized protein (TIGR02246 family)